MHPVLLGILRGDLHASRRGSNGLGEHPILGSAEVQIVHGGHDAAHAAATVEQQPRHCHRGAISVASARRIPVRRSSCRLPRRQAKKLADEYSNVPTGRPSALKAAQALPIKLQGTGMTAPGVGYALQTMDFVLHRFPF